MASEIRVDKINSLSGVGTVTLSPTGVDIAGITTVATLKATTGIVTTLTANTGTFTSGVTLTGNITCASGDLQLVNTGDDINLYSADDIGLFVQTNETAINCVGNGAVELYHDNTKRLETTSSGVSVTGTITSTDSANVADGHVQCLLDSGNGRLKLLNASDAATVDIQGSVGNVNIVDNGKLQIGSSQDLQIYHDGNNSFIENAGVGSLNLYGDEVNILNKAKSEFKAKFITDGAVELYHNNSRKFYTESTGIIVYGAGSTFLKMGSEAGGTDVVFFDTTHSSNTKPHMDFRLDADLAMRVDSSSNLQFNSGFGSVQTAYGVRAWVFINNTTGSMTPYTNGSGGVSSVDDLGAGAGRVNFSITMPNTAYATVSGNRRQGTYDMTNVGFSNATTSFRFDSFTNGGGSNADLQAYSFVTVR